MLEINYSKQAEKFLKKQTAWDDIEEVAPDDIDMQMLQDTDNDPECHEFTNEYDIVW